MAAPESTKFQVNFKAPDGTLVNLYAANKEELEALLTAAQDFSALIGSVSQSFSGSRPAAPVSGGQFSQPSAPSAPAVAGGVEVIQDKYGNTWTYGLPDAPGCIRGPMVLKQGVSKTGKAYKGFFDPATKGAPKWTGPTPTDLAQTIFTK